MQSSRSIISIGNFDGVHLGHQAIIHRMLCAAEQYEKKSGKRPRLIAMTFHPRPLEILRPDDPAIKAPYLLCNIKEREARLKRYGVDHVECITPTHAWLSMSPTAFMNWLWDHYKPCHIVEGDNFRFGHRRQGDMALLRQFGNQPERWQKPTITADTDSTFTVEAAPPTLMTQFDQWEILISSTHIRQLLDCGRVFDVKRCLGCAHHVTGELVPGEQRGRRQGIPTFNIKVDEHTRSIDGVLLPAVGVYTGAIQLHTNQPSNEPDNFPPSFFDAAISIGSKPTFDGDRIVLEVHIIDNKFDVEKLDKTNVNSATVRFDRYIRDQHAFPNADSLVEQIKRDIQKMKQFQLLGQS